MTYKSNQIAVLQIIIFVAFFIPAVSFANSCEGMVISGVIVENKSTNVIAADPNSLRGVDGNAVSGVQPNSTLAVQKANIKFAKIGSIGDCSVGEVKNGTLISIKLDGSNLLNVDFTEGSISDGTGQDINAVKNVTGKNVTMTSVSILKAEISLPPDLKDDPLGIQNGVDIVTRTDIKDTAGQTIPEFTRLNVQDSKDGIYTLYTDEDPCSISAFNFPYRIYYDFKMWVNSKPYKPDAGVCGRANRVDNQVFKVSSEDLKNKIVFNNWTTGALIVPYKYGLANHSLSTTSTTIGAYAGYEVDAGGSKWTWPIAAGITSVAVPSTQNGTSTVTQKTGLSIAAGILFNPKGTVKTGILFGVDQLGSNSGYQENGKVWMGLYVGTGFGY